MKKVLALSLLLLIFFRVPAFAGDDTVVAKIGDTKITMADFDRMISYYDAQKQKILAENPVLKTTILQRIVQGMVIAKIARDQGFDKRADIKEQIELMTNDLLASLYLQEEVMDRKITDEDMQLYYKVHRADFSTPAMVKVRQVFLKVTAAMTDQEKKELQEKAKKLLNRIRSGEDFARLAEEFSDDDASKTNGGDLGYFSEGQTMPDFVKTAFSLKPGEIKLVESPDGYHIIQLEERKEAGFEPFAAVKDKVREKASAEIRKMRLEDFVKTAMEKAKVQMYPELFSPKK